MNAQCMIAIGMDGLSRGCVHVRSEAEEWQAQPAAGKAVPCSWCWAGFPRDTFQSPGSWQLTWTLF